MSDDLVVARRYKVGEAEELAEWCRGYVVFGHHPLEPGRGHIAVRVPMRDGAQTAWVGDWIVRNADGEFTVVPNEEFVARHEPLF